MVMLVVMSVALSLYALPAAANEHETTTGEAKAQPSLFPLPGSAVYGGVPDPGTGSATQKAQNLVGGLINNGRLIIGTVAVVIIVFAGFRMVTGWGKEDVYGKQRLNILYAIVGLAIVAMAGELAKIFSVEGGGFIRDPNQILRTANLFNRQTQIIITFIKYIVGSIAVITIVRNAYRIIAVGSSEDSLASDKKNLVYSAIGLVLILVADNVINNVLFKVDLSRYPGTGGVQPAISAQAGVAELVGITNFTVSVVGPIAVLALLAGGVLYITAAGKEDQIERAKRIIMATLGGIILIYGAFAIISTIVMGRFE